MISAQALIFRSLFPVFENLLPLCCWLSSSITYNHKQCLLCWMLLNQLCVLFTFKSSSHSPLVTRLLPCQANSQFTMHGQHIPAFALIRLTFYDHPIKLAAKTKMRNTSNVTFTNLLRYLTLAPFWYLPRLLFATTTSVKVHSCYAQGAVVCNHDAQILCDPNPNSVLSPLSNIILLHIHHEGFFNLKTNTPLTSYCSFLPLLSHSTLSQIPGSLMVSLAVS